MRPVRPGNGFTLIELVIVITIIAITVGYAAPRLFTGFTTSGLDQAVRDLSVIVQYTQSQAVKRHKPYYVRFDFDEDLVGMYPRPEGSGLEPELEKKVVLPDGVALQGVKSPYQPKKDRGRIDIAVTSEGIVEPAVIYLEGPQNKVYTLEIKAFSGKFRIHDHYVEKTYAG